MAAIDVRKAAAATSLRDCRLLHLLASQFSSLVSMGFPPFDTSSSHSIRLLSTTTFDSQAPPFYYLLGQRGSLHQRGINSAHRTLLPAVAVVSLSALNPSTAQTSRTF